MGPIVLIILLITLVGLGVFGTLPNVDELLNPKNNLATIVYSGDMKILGKYYRENRVNVNFQQLDKDLVSALIATEDARFYEHSGVDAKALARTIMLGGGRGGGSTLTQQLAKMMFPRKKLSKPELLIRKVKEWIIATRLEKLYTKEEILSLYLNKFDFLNLAVGIKSAAQIYFNQTQDSLRIEQAAMLIGMAKNPSVFNPIRRPDTTLLRRNVVMSQMVKYGFLTQQKYDSLRTLPLGLSFRPENHNDGLATYFREYVRDNYLDNWCKKHINPETGKPYNIYEDGLKIYTTVDSRMQQYAEEAVYEHMQDLQKLFSKECLNKRNAPFAWNVSQKEIDDIMDASIKRSDRYRELKGDGLSHDEIIKTFHKPSPMRVYSLRGDIDTILTPYDSIRYYKSFLQTGFMAMEPQTGYVKAWVGGINHKHFQYDHVKVSKRQVGSTFKPFVYALAIQEGKSPCYQVPNVKTCITTETGVDWCPNNSDGPNDKNAGKMITLKKALANSINYITVWVMKQYGPHAVVSLVRRLGITADIPEVPSICLGTADISVFEMVAANSTFANKGTYIEPTFIARIEDKNGKVLEEFIPKSDEVFSEEKAYAMIQLMRGVVDGGTGTRLRSRYKLYNQIAGKTGTTQRNADGWFMGITPELVAGAWVGGEDRSIHFNSMVEGQGATMALPIWAKFFNKVYADKNLNVFQGDFPRPKNMDPNLDMDCSKFDGDVQPDNTENDNPFDNL
ncbi:transglycosylase domain-containing protein [Aurantibacillus circumpalustris]|uniref:transglycosylase domain-containing protein n=1 Tax=Aurantibacillus circumpalustris TaxID=3036359 RepID=UPI00295AF7B1|nr:transglycosylase domain-containing protein [Aurantibacillus circumpalustris]